jgi:hypothetical protein
MLSAVCWCIRDNLRSATASAIRLLAPSGNIRTLCVPGCLWHLCGDSGGRPGLAGWERCCSEETNHRPKVRCRNTLRQAASVAIIGIVRGRDYGRSGGSFASDGSVTVASSIDRSRRGRGPSLRLGSYCLAMPLNVAGDAECVKIIGDVRIFQGDSIRSSGGRSK